jgi:hypothetical protein
VDIKGWLRIVGAVEIVGHDGESGALVEEIQHVHEKLKLSLLSESQDL